MSEQEKKLPRIFDFLKAETKPNLFEYNIQSKEKKCLQKRSF